MKCQTQKASKPLRLAEQTADTQLMEAVDKQGEQEQTGAPPVAQAGQPQPTGGPAQSPGRPQPYRRGVYRSFGKFISY